MKQHWLVRVEPGNYGFFAMSKLDITQDGDEEVALCAWNGNTYIIDHRRNVVQFKFDENVLAFCAGAFPLTDTSMRQNVSQKPTCLMKAEMKTPFNFKAKLEVRRGFSW